MRAVTFQAPNEVRVEEKPDPEIAAADEALIRVEASGICGSDLHIYHGRVPVEQGFTIGHEYVGTVLDAGDGVDRVAVGDRVLGCFHTACATCAACLRGDYHRCERQRTFGHGSNLGDLQGAQAELLVVPRANLTLRRVPEGMSDEAALFAGDVMGTGYHAVAHAGMKAGRHGRGPRARPGRALRGAGGARRRRGEGLRDRLGRGAAGDGGLVRRRRRSTSPRRSRRRRCARRPRGGAWTSSSTRSATRRRWRWRSASAATRARSPASAPTPARARCRSASPGSRACSCASASPT